MLGLDHRDWPSFDLFCELVYGDKQVGVAPGCFLERHNLVEPPDHEGHVMGII